MSAETHYRRALRSSGLWLFAWPVAVWLCALVAGDMPAIIVAVALVLGSLNAAQSAFEAGRLLAERGRK